MPVARIQQLRDPRTPPASAYVNSSSAAPLLADRQSRTAGPHFHPGVAIPSQTVMVNPESAARPTTVQPREGAVLLFVPPTVAPPPRAPRRSADWRAAWHPPTYPPPSHSVSAGTATGRITHRPAQLTAYTPHTPRSQIVIQQHSDEVPDDTLHPPRRRGR